MKPTLVVSPQGVTLQPARHLNKATILLPLSNEHRLLPGIPQEPIELPDQQGSLYLQYNPITEPLVRRISFLHMSSSFECMSLFSGAATPGGGAGVYSMPWVPEVQTPVNGEGGGTQFMHDHSRMTIDLRIPTMARRRTSGFHLPGRHCLHQARSAVKRREVFGESHKG